MARVAALVVGELRNMHELVWRRHFIRTLHKLSAAWSAVYVSTWADQIGCLPGVPRSWRILEFNRTERPRIKPDPQLLWQLWLLDRLLNAHERELRGFSHLLKLRTDAVVLRALQPADFANAAAHSIYARSDIAIYARGGEFLSLVGGFYEAALNSLYRWHKSVLPLNWTNFQRQVPSLLEAADGGTQKLHVTLGLFSQDWDLTGLASKAVMDPRTMRDGIRADSLAYPCAIYNATNQKTQRAPMSDVVANVRRLLRGPAESRQALDKPPDACRMRAPITKVRIGQFDSEAALAWRVLNSGLLVRSFELPIACLLKHRYANCSGSESESDEHFDSRQETRYKTQGRIACWGPRVTDTVPPRPSCMRIPSRRLGACHK